MRERFRRLSSFLKALFLSTSGRVRSTQRKVLMITGSIGLDRNLRVVPSNDMELAAL
jgi:hypothetical protein